MTGRTVRGARSARSAVGAALAPLLPTGWQLVEHEATADGDAVRVRVAVRDIAPSTTGDASQHIVTTRATITVPADALEQAEADLDDAMDDFLFALDAADIPWSTATKGRYADEGGRLGFQLDIETRTTPTEETTNG